MNLVTGTPFNTVMEKQLYPIVLRRPRKLANLHRELQRRQAAGRLAPPQLADTKN